MRTCRKYLTESKSKMKYCEFMLKRVVWFVRALLRLRNFYWALIVAKYKVRPSRVKVVNKGKSLYLKDINLSLSKTSNYLDILANLPELNGLVKLLNAKIYIDTSEKLIVQIDGVNFIIFDNETIHIMREIYLDSAYRVEFPDPVVVVDVGMSVGIASLYFAKYLNAPVYSYEPFRKTFERSQLNFALNPDVAKQINPFNFGLGSEKKVVNAFYCIEASTSSGIFQISPELSKGKHVEVEEINIFPIQDVIDSICKQHPDREILLKMDCEGAEYEILHALENNDCLRKIKVIMMEWHRRSVEHDPSHLVRILVNNSFSFFVRGCFNMPAGTICGFRK